MFKTKQALAASGSEPQSYSSADVARLSGVSLRQLQWWDEQKVVSPQHDGHKRTYNMAEVVEVSVIAELRRKGFSLQKIRRVLRFLQKEMNRRLTDILAPESDIYLLTDGKHIYLEHEHSRIVDVIKSARQAMFVVSVSDQVRRLTTTPRKPVRSEISSAARKAKAV
jgi:DNA-binding transcriptional MerR regulator